MKKTSVLLLALLLILALVCACGKTKSEQDNLGKADITGVWAIENIKLIENDNPLFGSLAKVLNGYLIQAPSIEFKDDNTAQIGDVKIEYAYDGERLTLKWKDTQSFVFDVTEKDGDLQLNYQNYLKCVFKRI